MKPEGDADAGTHRVIAVVVSYAPDPPLFARVLAATKDQVEHIIVADNGGGSGLASVVWSDAMSRIDMGGNSGVAAAQNAGIARALTMHATHVLLLDHDSVPAPGMTQALLATWERLRRADVQVATVGANYRDARRPDVSPFVRVENFRLRRLDAGTQAGVAPVSYVISSGCLISRDAFRHIGPMNEALFIDYIDIEWGLRAGTKGWRCFGAFDAHLEHALGDVPLSILGKSYPLRSPLRHYYMVRNATWLIAKAKLPDEWKFVEGWRLFRRVVAYAIFAPSPHRHIAAMFKGLRDGLAGRLGEASLTRSTQTLQSSTHT